MSSTPKHLRDHCLAPERTDAPLDALGRYGRMFDLPPLRADETLLRAIGAAGGFCDGGGRESDATVAAGWPFFGQYIAHDLTADRSPLREVANVDELANMRSPRANLESLYGSGPGGSPYLYERDDPARLLASDGDLPRNQQGLALVGDPRNDVHVFMSQMQLAFLRAHNRLVDRLRADGADEDTLFDDARRSLTWHYQWTIVNDYLPGLVGAELVNELLASGPSFYTPAGVPFMPVEFADAAFRYGHSQIRPTYVIRAGTSPMAVFPDLIGFSPVGDREVDWSTMFDVPRRPAAQRSKRIDGTLPSSLIELPLEITGTVSESAYHSLAARDLQRGHGTGLPSGESVARKIGARVLSERELALSQHGWEEGTPLWLYILREADVQQDGDRLGEVGGRIVAEVLLGVIRADPESYLAVEPQWRPTLSAHDGAFRLRDLLVPA